MTRSIRNKALRQGYPALSGRIMVDTLRGQVRVRGWPKPRGRPKSARVRAQNEWFKTAQKIAKQADPGQMRLAVDWSRGTGLYPRDLLVNAMSGGMFDIIDDDDELIQFRKPFLEEVMWQGVVLRQTAQQILPVGVYTKLTWPLPILDTAGMWSITNPSRITIPKGVEIVCVEGGWHNNSDIQTGTVVPSIQLNGAFISRFPHRSEGFPGGGIQTGPTPVNEGDYFEFFVFVEDASKTDGTRENWFSCSILQARN